MRPNALRTALLRILQQRAARQAVDAASVRNQGARGVLEGTRARLARLDLARFSASSRAAFAARLDAETERLRRAMPAGGRHWGAARKSLNLFLRDVLYHRILCDHYRLRRLEPWLEIPLDSIVAAAIHRSQVSDDLPRWPGLKHLTPRASHLYQRAARSIAIRHGTARIHLDLLWLPAPKPDH